VAKKDEWDELRDIVWDYEDACIAAGQMQVLCKQADDSMLGKTVVMRLKAHVDRIYRKRWLLARKIRKYINEMEKRHSPKKKR